MSGFAGPGSDDLGDDLEHFSAHQAMGRVERLSRMHDIMHGAKSSLHTPASAESFVSGFTGQPARDEDDMCNLCGRGFNR